MSFKNRTKPYLLLFLACAGMLVLSTRWKHPDDGLVRTLPFQATRPGVYRLAHDITVPESAQEGFIVKADHVTLDLDEHTITCAAGPDKVSSGVLANNVRFFTLRNGTIQSCAYAFNGTGDPLVASHYTVENMVLKDNYFRGIRAGAQNSVIRDNTVSNTTGLQFYKDAFAMGIEVRGPYIVVQNNTVSDTRGTGAGEGVGISVTGKGMGTKVIGNVVTASRRDDFTDFALWVGGESDVQVKGNRLENYTYGVAASSPTRGCMEGNDTGRILHKTQFTDKMLASYKIRKNWKTTCTDD